MTTVPPCASIFSHSLFCVSEDLFGLKTIDQVVFGRHVVLLPGAEVEAYRQTKRIDYGVDFGAEAAA